MIDLEDERLGKISEILANKTCKKILSLLAERELSESDISKKLKLPINTVEYNLKKLVAVGLIEKGKSFFWSEKGKKIPLYKATRKIIIISPRAKARKIFGILLTAVISVILALFIKGFLSLQYSPVEKGLDEEAVMVGKEAVAASSIWIWFLFGALFALIILLIINWRKL